MLRHPGNTSQTKADLRFDMQHGFAKWTAKPHLAYVVENIGSIETPALNLTRLIGSIKRGGLLFPSTSSSTAPDLSGGSAGCMLPPAVLSSQLLAQTYGMEIDTNVLPIGSLAHVTDVPLPPDKDGHTCFAVRERASSPGHFPRRRSAFGGSTNVVRSAFDQQPSEIRAFASSLAMDYI